MYTYLARVTKVYDGDTLTCDIDLGFNMWMRAQKIRLADIDAPELVGPCRPAGLAARTSSCSPGRTRPRSMAAGWARSGCQARRRASTTGSLKPATRSSTHGEPG